MFIRVISRVPVDGVWENAGAERDIDVTQAEGLIRRGYAEEIKAPVVKKKDKSEA